MLIFFIIIFVVIGVVAHVVLPRMIVVTGDPATAAFTRAKGINDLEAFGLKISKEIQVESVDSLQLTAWLFNTPKDSANGTIILLHGIRSSKEYFLPDVHRFLEWGYNVVLMDNRSHGASQGLYCTFGAKEKEDVKRLVDELTKEDLQQNIGVWGQSLGGAIALQALAYDDRLKFGIIESTFSNFREIAQHYIQKAIPIFPRFFKNYLINRAGKLADFDPDSVLPSEAAKSIKVPVLMVHGEVDKNIPPFHGKRIFENLGSSQKQFHEAKGAAHANVWITGSDAYFNVVEDFLAGSNPTE